MAVGWARNRAEKAYGEETTLMKNPLESLPMTVVMGLVITVVMVLLISAIGG